MSRVVIYATRSCPYCMMARQLLTSKGVTFEEIAVDGNPDQRMVMAQRSGRRTVPQVFIDDQPVGGYDDLAALDRIGRLDRLLRG